MQLGRLGHEWRLGIIEARTGFAQHWLQPHGRQSMRYGLQCTQEVGPQCLAHSGCRFRGRPDSLPESARVFLGDTGQPDMIVGVMKHHGQCIAQLLPIHWLRQQMMHELAPQFREKACAWQQTAVGKKALMTGVGQQGHEPPLQGLPIARLLTQENPQLQMRCPDRRVIFRVAGADDIDQARQCIERCCIGRIKHRECCRKTGLQDRIGCSGREGLGHECVDIEQLR